MEFKFATGGREKYFKVNIHTVRDCVVRAICNATGKDYLEVYNAINALAKSERTGKRKRGTSSARNGVYKGTIKKYIEGELGWVWVPCMTIGSGCQVHLDANELPKGTIILSLSKHLTCVKDGVIYDTYDCSRDGDRCVYGYWREPTPMEKYIHDDLKAAQELARIKIEKEKSEKLQQNKAIRAKNEKIKKAYAKKINALNRKIRALERERDSKLIPLVK